MGSPFKMNPKTPLMKALVGKQKNLPQHLQDAIKAAPESPAKSYGKSPMKKTDPGKKKTLSQVKSGEYTDIRDYTPEELTAQVRKTGKSSFQIKRDVASYRKKASAERKAASNVTPNSGKQMASILAEGGARGEKGIAEAAKRRSAGKSPAQMNGGKKKSKANRGNSIGPKPKIEEGKNTIPKMKQTKSDLRKNYRTGGKSPAKMIGNYKTTSMKQKVKRNAKK